jgi:hypothetical protein
MTGEVFKPQKAYVDDLIVKVQSYQWLSWNIRQHEKSGIENESGSIFGVTKGMILGCLISAKKIEANPDK